MAVVGPEIGDQWLEDFTDALARGLTVYTSISRDEDDSPGLTEGQVALNQLVFESMPELSVSWFKLKAKLEPFG